MEYHASPSNEESLKSLQMHRHLQRDCMAAAAISSGLVIKAPMGWRVSDEETHYWLSFKQVNEDKNTTSRLVINDYTRYYTQLYLQYTNIPPDEVVLVETVKVTSEQVSGTWEFVNQKEVSHLVDRWEICHISTPVKFDHD